MAFTYPKAVALVRGMVDNLNQRFSTNATTAASAFDSNGDAYLTVTLNAGGNHSVVAIVRIKATATIQTDAIGNTQRVYSPHIAQVVFDINASGTTSAQKAKVLWDVLRLGTKVEWYDKDPGGSNIALTDITGANLILALEDIPFRDISMV